MTICDKGEKMIVPRKLTPEQHEKVRTHFHKQEVCCVNGEVTIDKYLIELGGYHHMRVVCNVCGRTMLYDVNALLWGWS